MSLLAQMFDKQTVQIGTIIGIVIGLFFALILLAIFARYFRLWIQSVTTGAGIGIFDLLGMTFRKVNPAVIVRSKIMAVQAGIGDQQGATSKAMEAHYLAGGNVPLVIRALVAAAKAKLVELDFKLATAIDLAGRNVLEAVQTSVYPKVIDCPDRSTGRESLDGIAQNGIQLKVRARVTVRANLRQLIGGAGEETIIARVGARLQADQAEADMRVARAKAEGRRAMAVAEEQEMIAQIEQNRAKVLEAEAEVPKAISQAFRSNKLGLMDYYKIRNIKADTEMRSSIAKTGPVAAGSTTSSAE